ncbi:DMT family transporter [Streptomyces albidoflavus]|uniref:DMT family transporter n=1 Tax=Streptomyces TaxID=1883 RepID=UPI00101E4949|nr:MULTISPECIES: EamA family transporter [Streptomyces]MCO6751915.1 EamA family transporter [Streptomyces sp. IpFD-1.1]RZE20621.1 EamA family transporter [Streptomyces albidoflavus]
MRDGRGGGVRAGGRVAVLALLWGSTFLWIDLALEGFSPVQITFVRCALGAALLLVLARRAGVRLPRGRKAVGRLLVAAFLCNTLPFALFSLGQQSVDSGVAGVLNATTPLWSLLIGLLAGERGALGARRLAGLATGFAGTVLIFAPWQPGALAGWAALALLGAAVSYALAFTWMGRMPAGQGVPAIGLSAAQLTAATVLAALLLPWGGPPPRAPGAVPVLALLVLGIFATGVTFHLTYRTILAEGPTQAAAVGYLLPVVSVLLGAVVLGERVGWRVVAGMAVVLGGVVLTRWGARARPKAPAGGEAERPEPLPAR